MKTYQPRSRTLKLTTVAQTGRYSFWRASTGMLRLFVIVAVLPIIASSAAAQTATNATTGRFVSDATNAPASPKPWERYATTNTPAGKRTLTLADLIAERRSEQNTTNAPANPSGVTTEKSAADKFQELKQKAEHGDATAQNTLGEYYSECIGVTNNAEAAKWFRKSAEQGNAIAQYNLGSCYYYGAGVSQDYVEAVKWCRKAAEQGHSGSQVRLGDYYSESEGVTKNGTEAVKWYRKAAEQGDTTAQVRMGGACLSGEGVPQDFVEAYKWYNLAATQGEIGAGDIRDKLSQEMTREQIAEAQRRASKFFARKEKGGDHSTVQPDAADVPVGSGTGFLITAGKNPCVLTAHHVVKEATAIKVVMGGKPFLSRVVGADPANDLTVLQITVGASGQQTALPITASRSVKLGDTVFTVGFPDPSAQGVSPKLTRGEINSLAGIQDDPRYFQTSVAVQPGNSGGALVDARGNVVGVITMRLDDLETLKRTGSLPQNVNYGLKSSFVLAFLESLSELAPALPPPHTEDRKFEDVVKEVQQAAVLVLTY